MASSTVIMGNLTSRVMLSLYHEYFSDIVSTVFLLFFHTVDIEDCRLCHWQPLAILGHPTIPGLVKKNSLCDVLYLLLIIIFVYHPSVVRHREFVTKSMRMCGSSRILPFIFT